MAGRTGITSNDYIGVFDESKREIAVVAQGAAPGDKARPLTDIDWNAMQMVMLTLLRRHAQWGSRSGACHDDAFRIAGTGGNNDFTVHGPSAAIDSSPFYTVAGLPALAPFTSCAFSATADAGKDWVHAKCTHLTDTQMMNTSAMWKPGALVDRSLYLKTGGVISSWKIVANGINWVRVAGGTTMTASHAAGCRFWISPTKPYGGPRTDLVWLDVYLDEVGAVAVPGDPDFDAALNLNVGGAVLETTRRLALRQSVWYSQGGTSDIAFTPLGDDDYTYTYTDTDDNVHYCVQLAQVNRRDNDVYICADDVEDLRVFAGVAIHRQTSTILGMVLDGGVLNGFAASRNAGAHAQLDIAQGALVGLGGVRLYFGAQSFTGPTGGGAWVAERTYYAVVDVGRRMVVKTSVDAGDRMIASFVAVGASDIGATVTDLRKFVVDVTGKFAFDANGALGASLKIKRGAPIEIYDDNIVSPTRVATFGNSSRSIVSLRVEGATKYLSIGAIGAGVGDGVSIECDPTIDETADPDVGGGNTGGVRIVTCGAVMANDAANAPKVWKLRAVDAMKLRAPGIEFGDSSLAAAPIALNVFVPAIKGSILYIFTDFGQSHQIKKSYSALQFDLSSGYYGTFPTSSGGHTPMFLLPLDVPRGTKITSIVARFCNALTSTAALSVDAQIYYQDAMTGTVLSPSSLMVPVGSRQTLVMNSANNGYPFKTFDVASDPGVLPLINSRKHLYLSIEIPTAATLIAPSTSAWFLGAEVNGILRAFGELDTGATTYQSLPWPGM